MKLKSALPAIAALGLVVAPVAAQAGTAAGSSVVSARSLSAVGERRSSSVKQAERLTPALWLVVLLGVGAATYGVVKATDDNKSNG